MFWCNKNNDFKYYMKEIYETQIHIICEIVYNPVGGSTESKIHFNPTSTLKYFGCISTPKI